MSLCLQRSGAPSAMRSLQMQCVSNVRDPRLIQILSQVDILIEAGLQCLSNNNDDGILVSTDGGYNTAAISHRPKE